MGDRTIGRHGHEVPGVAFELLGGRQAAAHAGEFQELHGEVFAEDADRFAGVFRVQCRQPGFALVEARHGEFLVGYASGMPLRPSTSWWNDLTSPLPDDVTAEYPGRTFAVLDLLVRASWRRQGIGATLHDRLLRNRAEERATLTVPPAAAPAQQAFRSWGWHKIARTRDPGPGAVVCDVLVRPFPGGR
jgi:GNAT superfamily N-acetyltransferase